MCAVFRKKLVDINFLVNKYQLDILSINETHLDTTINDFELNISGFSLYRNDRNRHGGGVAIYIRDEIKHKLRSDLFVVGLESVWVEITTDDGSSYLLCSMYRPPSSRNDYYDMMIENIELASVSDHEIILMGDLNFDYVIDESLSSNPIHLIESLFEMTQLVENATRRTITTSTLIDVILTTASEKHLLTGILETTFSDHYCVYTVLDISKPTLSKHKHNYVKFRDFKNFDETAFLNDVKKNDCFLNPIKETDVVRGWGVWKETLLTLSHKHAPFVERRLKKRNNPWVSPDIVKLMYRRDFLHKKAVSSKDQTLWKEYQRARNNVNAAITLAKTRYYDDAIDHNKNNPRMMWKKINELIRDKKKNVSCNHGISAYSFNEYFSKVGHTVVISVPSVFVGLVHLN